MVRKLSTAEASFADIRELIKLGIAIAAMMRMIATTINNSMREKPACFIRMENTRKASTFHAPKQRFTTNTVQAKAHSRPFFWEIDGLLGAIFPDDRHKMSIRAVKLTKNAGESRKWFMLVDPNERDREFRGGLVGKNKEHGTDARALCDSLTKAILTVCLCRF